MEIVNIVDVSYCIRNSHLNTTHIIVLTLQQLISLSPAICWKLKKNMLLWKMFLNTFPNIHLLIGNKQYSGQWCHAMKLHCSLSSSWELPHTSPLRINPLGQLNCRPCICLSDCPKSWLEFFLSTSWLRHNKKNYLKLVVKKGWT